MNLKELETRIWAVNKQARETGKITPAMISEVADVFSDATFGRWSPEDFEGWIKGLEEKGARDKFLNTKGTIFMMKNVRQLRNVEVVPTPPIAKAVTEHCVLENKESISSLARRASSYVKDWEKNPTNFRRQVGMNEQRERGARAKYNAVPLFIDHNRACAIAKALGMAPYELGV